MGGASVWHVRCTDAGAMKITRRHVIAAPLVLVVVALAAFEARPSGWRSAAADSVADFRAVVATRLTPPRRDTRWVEHLRVVDGALMRSDVSLAVRAWHDAYGAAIASGEWQAMLSVGDAFVGIGRTAHSREGAKANARLAYLAAIDRARRDGSVHGALGVARAFAALGDREVASQCVEIATRIASERDDRAGLELVREYARGARERS